MDFRKALALAAAFGVFSLPAAAGEFLMPVPNRVIYPGEVLKGSDFTPKLFRANATAQHTYLMDEGQLQRMEASRVLAAGKPVPLSALRLQDDVKKGSPTKATYASGIIEIQASLIPLSAGTRGQVISARNPTTGEIIHAEVTALGTLKVLPK